MLHYAKENLTPEQEYKFLSGSIVPRPIAWVTTLSPDQAVINVAPFSLFSVVSKELPLISISIMRQAGEQKDTAFNLSQTREAVIHIVDDSLLKDMNQSSASLARDQTELAQLSVTTVASQRVKVPGITEAKIRFEGKVYQQIPVYNQDRSEILTDLFIIEILDYHFSEAVFDLEKEYVDVERLKPVARLAGPHYGVIGTTYELRRPQ